MTYNLEWNIQGSTEEHDPVVDFVPRRISPSRVKSDSDANEPEKLDRQRRKQVGFLVPLGFLAGVRLKLCGE